MTDDIRADGGPPVDLLIVGGLTIDVLPDEGEVVGGAARYATEAAIAAGLRVALHTVAADEPPISELVARLGERAEVTWQRAPTTISFEHHGADHERRLRLRSTADPLRVPDPARLPRARAVLFAPVAGEVSSAAILAVSAPTRVAGMQGWLRRADGDGWIQPIEPGAIDDALARAIRGLDLLTASHSDLGQLDGPSGLAALRAWAGPGPGLAVTAGTDGAWLDDGEGQTEHVAAEVIEGRRTIGAGDAFAAILTARLGSGLGLSAAAVEAAAATARYLAARPTVGASGNVPADLAASLARLDGTRWHAAGSIAGQLLPPDAEFSLEFQGERLAGRSGCNRYMGTWAVVDGVLRIGQLASTMMYCDGLMELERLFLDALQDVASVEISESQLILVGPGGNALLEFALGAQRPGA